MNRNTIAILSGLTCTAFGCILLIWPTTNYVANHLLLTVGLTVIADYLTGGVIERSKPRLICLLIAPTILTAVLAQRTGERVGCTITSWFIIFMIVRFVFSPDIKTRVSNQPGALVFGIVLSLAAYSFLLIPVLRSIAAMFFVTFGLTLAADHATGPQLDKEPVRPLTMLFLPILISLLAHDETGSWLLVSWKITFIVARFIMPPVGSSRQSLQ